MQAIGKYAGNAGAAATKGKYLTLNVNVAEAAKVKKATITKTEASVQPIKDDVKVDETANKFKVVSAATTSGTGSYTLVPVSFTNQYDGAMDVKLEASDASVHKLGGNVTAKLGDNEIKVADTNGIYNEATKYDVGFFDKDGKLITSTDWTVPVAFIGIHAIASSADDTKLTLTYTPSGETAAVTEEIDVKPQAVRALKTVELDKASATLSASTSTFFKVDAKDQYGKPFDLKTSGGDGSLVPDHADVCFGSDTALTGEGDIGSTNYQLEYFAAKADGTPADAALTSVGTVKYIQIIAENAAKSSVPTAGSTLKLYKKDHTSTDTVLAEAKIDFVKEQDVDKIDIVDNSITATTTGKDTATYTTGTVYALYADTTNNTYTIPVTAFANNVPVVVTDDFYKAGTVTVKDKEGNDKTLTTKTASVSGGKLTVTLQGGTAGKLEEGDVVTVSLESKTNIEPDTLSFKISLKQPELKTDVKVVNASDVKDANGAYPAVDTANVSAITTYTDENSEEVTKVTQLAMQGVDQYGVLRNTAEDQTLSEVSYYSTEPTKTVVLDNGILIPLDSGTTTIRISSTAGRNSVNVTVPATGLGVAPTATAGTFSSQVVTISSGVDSGKKYSLVNPDDGEIINAIASSTATFTFTGTVKAGSYYLFETDTDGNITSYAATVNVTKTV